MNDTPPLTPPKSDVGLIVEINDGPEYKPNFKRRVELIAWDPTPGFVVCRDTKTEEILRVSKTKIEQAKLEAFGLKREA
jgi:hypothetical protein